MEIVCPGQRLGELGPFLAGSGTFAHRGKIYASIVGVRQETKTEEVAWFFGWHNFEQKVTVSVHGVGEQPLVVPEVECLVTCKVVLLLCWLSAR